MTYLTVDFDDGEKYVGNRPKGVVILKGSGGSHGTTWKTLSLVDTGADFMHLPDEAATKVGISLANARVIRVSTAGGIIKVKRKNVDLEIQGISVNVPVNFSKGAKPLIGRQAIFMILDNLGFSTTEWLLDWHQPQQIKPATSSTTQQQSSSVASSEEPDKTVGSTVEYREDGIYVGGLKVPHKRGLVD